ncbi:hypothetical protein [Streptomyces phaeoluteigriseus]
MMRTSESKTYVPTAGAASSSLSRSARSGAEVSGSGWTTVCPGPTGSAYPVTPSRSSSGTASSHGRATSTFP